jgi:hypothetical protein
MAAPAARPARAAHSLCVCRGPIAVCYAEQREGESRAPPRRVSPGSGRAPPVRVSRPCRCRVCRAARGRGQGPSLPGLARFGPRTDYACVAVRFYCCRFCRAARREEQGPSPPGLARLGQHAACACVAVPSLSAVPSSEREGIGSLPAGSRPARAAHCLCVCGGHVADGCAEQREGGSRAPPSRVSSGSGRAPPMRVLRPSRCRLCRAAKGRVWSLIPCFLTTCVPSWLVPSSKREGSLPLSLVGPGPYD